MRLGRTFVSPAFDVLLIGGVLSIPVALIARAGGIKFDAVSMWQILLLTSYAHVAASLIRLYSKPEVVRQRPALTVGLPLALVLATGWFLLARGRAADCVQGIYITWSSYHYAAQTYGLALMYVYRSGGSFTPREKRFLQVACLATFVYAVLGPAAGITMIVPASVYATWPALEIVRQVLRAALLVFLLGGPIALAVYRQRRGHPLPMMSLILVATNALWWVLFVPADAFAWAALSHGVQYAAIATIFHVKDSKQAPNNRRGTVYHTLTFYVACVALAYALYYGAPPLFAMVSYKFAHSAAPLRIALMLNLHHVILDGFIWRRASAPVAAGATGMAHSSLARVAAPV